MDQVKVGGNLTFDDRSKLVFISLCSNAFPPQQLFFSPSSTTPLHFHGLLSRFLVEFGNFRGNRVKEKVTKLLL